MSKVRLALCLALCLLPPALPAATHTAASTSYSDVNDKLALCNDGDTLEIPSGSSTWNSVLNVTKAITIRGAGTNNTIITGGTLNFLTIAMSAANKSWRLTELTLNCGTLDDGGFGVAKFSGGIGRIDRCLITNGANNSVQLNFGDVIGVVDHCVFKMNGQQAFNQRNNTWDGVGETGDWSWGTNHTMGTTNTLVIEDCALISVNNQNPVYDCGGGARVCIRYCFMTNSYTRAHGTESNGRSRGVRQFEFYFNRQGMGDGGDPGNEIRSGTGVAFSNETSQASIVVLKYFRGSASHAPWGQWANGWDCGGYPALDQPGVGKGDYMSGGEGTDPPINPSSATCMNQQRETWHAWGNTNAAGTARTIGLNDFVNAVSGRDYSNAVLVGYSPLTYPHPLITAQDGGGGGGADPNLKRKMRGIKLRQ